MQKVFHVLVLSLALVSAGWNTIKGVGKDIQKAGETIEDSAKKK